MAASGGVETFGLSLNRRPRPNSPVNSCYTTDTGLESLRTISMLDSKYRQTRGTNKNISVVVRTRKCSLKFSVSNSSAPLLSQFLTSTVLGRACTNLFIMQLLKASNKIAVTKYFVLTDILSVSYTHLRS